MGVLPDGRRHTREDSGIRLDRHGQWWHDGQPIEHPKIIEAFNRGLSPTDEGRFRLQFGNDWCYVEVEDAAYRVLEFAVGEQGPSVELSDRTSEPLDVQTLSRDAQFALGERLTERGEQLVLDLGSKAIPVPLRLRPQR